MNITGNHRALLIACTYKCGFLLLGLTHTSHISMAPKRRKPSKKKDAIVTSTTDDNTSASNANNDVGITAKAAASKKRRVTETTQKAIGKTKQTKVSCSQKQGTKSSNNTQEKQPPKNGRSRRRNESEIESSAMIEKKPRKRVSKTKAASKITGHFEDVEKTPPLDGLALVKAEKKIWEEIAGMQKNECGMTDGGKDGRRTVGNCRDNEEEIEEDVGGDETESGAKKSKSGAKKRKGKVENKSANCQDTGTKLMKRADEGEDEQKDAVYDMNDEMDAGACVQEAAKGNKYIGAHTSISGKCL